MRVHGAVSVALLVGVAAAQSRIYHLPAPTPPATAYGHAVSAAGDVDGDGHADIAIGAPFSSYGTGGVGFVDVVRGRDGTLLFRWLGTAPQSELGYAVAGVGDVSGDGRPDVLIGEPSHDGGTGRALLRSGADGRLLAELRGSVAGERFGDVVEAAGDVDRDGVGDLLVASAVGPQQQRQRRVVVYSGATLQPLHTWTSRAGRSVTPDVAPVGDVDRDGHADVAISDPEDSNTFYQGIGSVSVYSGRTGREIGRAEGIAADDFFGATIGAVGDVNGDDHDDFAAFGWSSLLRVVSGRDCRTTLLTVLPPWDPSDIEPAGDLDDDGCGDFLVGCRVPPPGSVRLHSGRDGTVLTSWTGGAGLDHFGASVDLAGDVDGDGRPDVVIGADWPQAVPGPYVDVYSTAPLALTTDGHLLSLQTGGVQTMSLEAGTARAGDPYWLLGSFSGTSPGIPFGPYTLPLNLDGYLVATALHPNVPPFSGFAGTLSPAGRATASFTLPPGMPQVLAGVTAHHAFFVLTGPAVALVSNPVPLTFAR